VSWSRTDDATRRSPSPLLMVTRSQVLSWLQDREPQPPRALVEQLDAAVRAAPESLLAAESLAGAVANLGVATLRAVARRQGVAYDTAMDLLAADALVTYAFEAASEEYGDVTGLARRLLSELSA
jgi:hypothetical protein